MMRPLDDGRCRLPGPSSTRIRRARFARPVKASVSASRTVLRTSCIRRACEPIHLPTDVIRAISSSENSDFRLRSREIVPIVSLPQLIGAIRTDCTCAATTRRAARLCSAARSAWSRNSGFPVNSTSFRGLPGATIVSSPKASGAASGWHIRQIWAPSSSMKVILHRSAAKSFGNHCAAWVSTASMLVARVTSSIKSTGRSTLRCEVSRM